eukprot:scaffold6553_cov67-Phaeocystis_antarctica.AAC.3
MPECHATSRMAQADRLLLHKSAGSGSAGPSRSSTSPANTRQPSARQCRLPGPKRQSVGGRLARSRSLRAQPGGDGACGHASPQSTGPSARASSV